MKAGNYVYVGRARDRLDRMSMWQQSGEYYYGSGNIRRNCASVSEVDSGPAFYGGQNYRMQNIANSNSDSSSQGHKNGGVVPSVGGQWPGVRKGSWMVSDPACALSWL